MFYLIFFILNALFLFYMNCNKLYYYYFIEKIKTCLRRFNINFFNDNTIIIKRDNYIIQKHKDFDYYIFTDVKCGKKLTKKILSEIIDFKMIKLCHEIKFNTTNVNIIDKKIIDFILLKYYIDENGNLKSTLLIDKKEWLYNIGIDEILDFDDDFNIIKIF